METAAGLLRIKAGFEPDIERWRDTLLTRRDEAMETLRAEGVEIESWFELRIEGRTYLLWYMRAPSIDRVWEVFNASKLDIDNFHRELLGSITANAIEARPLLDLCEDGSSPPGA